MTLARLAIKYRAYKFLTASYFGFGVMFPFFEGGGFSKGDLFVFEAALIAIKTLVDLPSGHLADRQERRWLLCLGCFATAAAFLGIAARPDWIAMLGLFALRGFGLSFMVGPDSAMVYDHLQANDAAAEYPRIEADAIAASLYGFAIAPVLGSLAYSHIGPHAPFLMTAAAMVAAAVLASRFPERGAVASPLTSVRALHDFILAVRQGRFQYLAIAFAATAAFSRMGYWLLPLWLLEGDLDIVQVALILSLIVLLSGLVARGTSRYAVTPRPALYVGGIGCLAASFSLGWAATIARANWAPFALGFAALLFIVINGAYAPLYTRWINQYSDATWRSKAHALTGAFTGCSYACSSLAVGFMLNRFGALASMTGLLTLMAACCLVLAQAPASYQLRRVDGGTA
ncbi:MFS transporter [Verminephrobacter aporrectodeae subsp. tuberculatae]|uniref:MFS transporter n=1 Tax=Verminephrobacter aporrectodeae TaxID=1110389 RepID=UPI0022382251|nr:MFS transporter [Verminephrobacter aporrectodeae]MCW5221059.1 MFS transporter [Verminephrobacter aporrectodeae subsp. tuberculatae]MCW5290352.1 MFS transporter [Verminephrobacter aporrectodeae subsp. tuberculatae]